MSPTTAKHPLSRQTLRLWAIDCICLARMTGDISFLRNARVFIDMAQRVRAGL